MKLFRYLNKMRNEQPKINRGGSDFTPTTDCGSCPPLAFQFLMYEIGENQPVVGSWYQSGRFCPPLAYAEAAPLLTPRFAHSEIFR